MSSRRLDFSNLPLIEAAVRLSLSSPVELTYAALRSLARHLESDFPALTEPKQLEIAPGFGPSPGQLGPSLPGAVYTGNPHGLSVSVHAQVIVARWVREYGPQEKSYPRFASLRDSLWSAAEGLERSFGSDFPPPAVVNMSYVNFLPNLPATSAIGAYFSERAQLRAMDNAKQIRKLEAAWGEDDTVDVRFALEQATAKLGDRAEEGYRLTTAAGNRLGSSQDARGGLDVIHDRLQEFFLSLISEKAMEEWGLKR